MAESGLRPAEILLNNRSRRQVLRLLSLPKGAQAKSLPGCDTTMGQRKVRFSEYSVSDPDVRNTEVAEWRIWPIE